MGRILFPNSSYSHWFVTELFVISVFVFLFCLLIQKQYFTPQNTIFDLGKSFDDYTHYWAVIEAPDNSIYTPTTEVS